MARKEDTTIRDSLTRLLPAAKIRHLAEKTGAVRRRRKVDIVALVYSLVLGFSVGTERSLAGLRRAYERVTSTRLAPSAFYNRFSAQLVCLLEEMLSNALGKMSREKPRLRGIFQRFSAVLACDSTILRLNNALEEAYPSIWTHYMRASAKLQVVMNVVGRGARSVRLAAGSTHDLRLLECGPWMRGRLLIFDLAFFRSALFKEIGDCGGFYLARLKKHTSPLILASHRREHRHLVGQCLKDVMDLLTGDIVDLEVELRYFEHIRRHKVPGIVRYRVVGVRIPETGELRLYVTNAPLTHLQARHVAAIYAARWEVELMFRELKTRYRIEKMPSRSRAVSECLIYAALLTMLVARQLRTWLLELRPSLAARIPMDRWAVLLETFANDLLDILIGPRALRLPLARRLKLLLLHEATDPNRCRLHLVERAQMGVMPTVHCNA